MLDVKNLVAGYAEKRSVLHGINVKVSENEALALVGQNGSGKSTFAKAIMGMVPFIRGEIVFGDKSLIGMSTSQIAGLGIGLFMQGGRIFPNLTVEENLDFCVSHLRKKVAKSRKQEISETFPWLRSRSKGSPKASYLSGGEQHQLALAMVLAQDPKLLILDEPSAGLSPVNADLLYGMLERIKKQMPRPIIVIEQNVLKAIDFAERVLLLSEGIIKKERQTIELRNISLAADFYLTL